MMARILASLAVLALWAVIGAALLVAFMTG
jgi:hypothetical protein